MELVKFFLNQHYKEPNPIILGLSGGPDSMALFYLLLEYKKNHPLALHVAHVDHGWREESRNEALFLQNLAEKYGLPFHLTTLEKKQPKENLEAYSRDRRLEFFKKIAIKVNAQAILLAHHSDDLAETVVKRVFEGGALTSLAPIKKISKIHDIILWRPLLECPKKELVNWLNSRDLSYFEDMTNLNPRFLRGKMRVQLLPFLQESFGKKIRSNLCFLASEAQELGSYLEKRLKVWFDRIERGPAGIFCDLSEFSEFEPLYVKYFIQKFCNLKQFNLSREKLNTAVKLFLEGAANIKILMHQNLLYMDRRRLFIFENSKGHLGTWELSIEHLENPFEHKDQGWLSVWSGNASVVLPKAKYLLALPTQLNQKQGLYRLSKWWNAHKVPAIFRPQTPVVTRDGEVVHEFLTGERKLTLQQTVDSYILLRLKLNCHSKPIMV